MRQVKHFPFLISTKRRSIFAILCATVKARCFAFPQPFIKVFVRTSFRVSRRQHTCTGSLPTKDRTWELSKRNNHPQKIHGMYSPT